jgi:hypothetical protein
MRVRLTKPLRFIGFDNTVIIIIELDAYKETYTRLSSEL